MTRPKRIGFYLLDGFATMSTAAAMEPLRAANMFADTVLYEFCGLSTDGAPARSSLPADFETRALSHDLPRFDLIFVVAGGDPLQVNDATLFAWLREQDRRGIPLGGISGGAAILARAGLMEGRRFTVHWHHLDALRCLSASYLIERRLFVIDRDRYTCAGGTAPLDMMHAIITADHGARFARRIADWFIQTDIRAASDPQQASIAARYGPLPAALEQAITLMESHIADPLNATQLATLVDLSTRQLHRQFLAHLGQSPMQIYRVIRLTMAKDLLQRSHLPLSDIAEMTGFASQAAFSTAFSKWSGRPPREARSERSQARPANPIST
ncbi:MAG: GlxA family transcriptional regulator [Pseudomonadota bacterium]